MTISVQPFSAEIFQIDELPLFPICFKGTNKNLSNQATYWYLGNILQLAEWYLDIGRNVPKKLANTKLCILNNNNLSQTFHVILFWQSFLAATHSSGQHG